MKVYVLNMEYAYGTLNGVECVGVYDTEEKAQKALEDEIERVRERWQGFKEIDVPIGVSIIKGKGEGVISTEWAQRYYIIIGKEVQ